LALGGGGLRSIGGRHPAGVELTEDGGALAEYLRVRLKRTVGLDAAGAMTKPATARHDRLHIGGEGRRD
jgi:hypothetical protein